MSQIPWLGEDLLFPPVTQTLEDPEGLLAAGGDLSAERLLLAYSQGIFPWYSEDQPILWWSPEPRCLIDIDSLHISKSMRKALNKKNYTVTIDSAFEAVITACASPRGDTEGTWITKEMIEAYIQLHRQGHAHSFEVWEGEKVGQQGTLIGGLYGISIGRCYFGESMFSNKTNASKIAFVYLVNQLSEWGYQLIDCQLENDHLLSLGAYTVCKNEFLTILNSNVNKNQPNPNWDLNWQW